MSFVRLVCLLGSLCLARALLAQSSVPTLMQPIPAQALSPGSSPIILDLRNHFGVPGVVGTQFAQFDTVLGRFAVELRDDAAPRHVANFMTYVQAGDYNNSFFHRRASVDANPAAGIIQGGGYRLPITTNVPRRAPIALEYNLANARGTLAAARTSDINSATSEWYFNVRDNSTSLGPANGGGYSVFGRVMGTGMSVVDALAALPVVNASGTPDPNQLFGTLPVRNFSGGTVTEANLALVNAVTAATLFPSGGGRSVVEFAVQNSAPNAVAAELLGSTLTIRPLAAGAATVTVRAADTNGNTAESTFAVTVAAGTPVFNTHPLDLTVTAGSTAVLTVAANGSATYRWERNGTEIAGGSSGNLVISNVTAANAGSYVAIATNSAGSTRTAPATLTVATLPPTQVGRLVNLSILTVAGAGSRVLTMGAFVGGGETSGALPIVIRAVGPTLAQPPFNVGGVLPDPTMTLYPAGSTTPIETNDNWGGSAAMADAFRQVAAFELPAASLDSAIVRNTPGIAPGGYTVQVAGKGDASGSVIAEMYDASGNARTATTPRLINLSTLGQIDNGGNLTVGFVLGGQSARTVLVRGVGPSLSQFNVPGVLTDPQLELFNNNTNIRIGLNDDWAGSPEIAAAANSVGAFALTGGSSKDAVLLVTLPPGPYSARISGVGGGGGAAIVEVYEVQ